jgi:hypothetical protein
VLDWIAAPSDPVVVAGKERRHASMEGNALAVCCRLGMAHSLRVRHLAEVHAHRSSFHETLGPIWGLIEYHRGTGDGRARKAARRAGELLLERRLFRSLGTGDVIHPEWLQIHWPHYWHYDFFHGLRAIATLGMLSDPRADEALETLAKKRRDDGTWRTSGERYWQRSGESNVEVVDWGDAHEIVTAAALAMLQ